MLAKNGMTANSEQLTKNAIELMHERPAKLARERRAQEVVS